MATIEPCQFLRWDTEFFGYRIARVIGHKINLQQLKAILKWCENHKIECLYFLADPDDAETVMLAEDYGFRLVDIRVTLECNLKYRQAALINDLAETVHMRSSRPSDIPTLRAIARTVYSDSRFYFDPCFPKEACDALYETWIQRSCEGYADIVFVAEENRQLVGYISCHLLRDTAEGQIGLLGVDDQARNHGIGKLLVNHSLKWFAEHSVEKVIVVTQGRNVAAQRLYQRCGFLTQSVQLWYHKWMVDCTSRGNHESI